MTSALLPPRVFSIASGNRFLESLARELLDGRLVPGLGRSSGPMVLAAATIYVPTRRAAQALTQVFAGIAGTATLLPRILPLGALDQIEDSLLLADAFASTAASPPQAMPPVERRLALARLLGAWNARLKTAFLPDPGGVSEALAVAASARDSLMLADELGALIDELIIDGVAWEQLGALAPGHDRYWDMTRDLLAIAGEYWPRHLEELGVIDAAERQNRLLLAEAARLEALRPEQPYIVAGSTGSRPATAALMRAIACLPNGAIVLPGLDTALDAPGWDAIGKAARGEARPAHPQEGMKRLIAHLGAERRDVIEFDAVSAPLAARRSALSEIMRPAVTTDRWREAAGKFSPAEMAAAWRDVSVVSARDGREEALAIALAMREALEIPGRTAALITPDRALAARVQSELKRWEIIAADSAGTPLASTGAGILARLTAEAVSDNFSARAVAALLGNADVTLGLPRGKAARLARLFEIACLRGIKLAAGAAGIRAALAQAPARLRGQHAPPYMSRISAADIAAAAAMINRLLAALEPLHQAIHAPEARLSTAIAALITATEALTERAPGNTRWPLHGEAALADLADAVAAADGAGFTCQPHEFAATAEALMAGSIVPDRVEAHPRLHILGLLESRLLHADLVITAGLTEGVWPPAAQTGPFLNRPMRAELGLDPPERRIGQTALDFTAALGTPEVIISHAARAGAEPASPSRLLRRMEAFLGKPQWQEMTKRGERWLSMARALDRPEKVAAAARPEPKPPVALRPVSLSVSEIETLYRDPYAIYAKHILKLAPFEPIDPDPDAGDRGEWIHQAIAETLKQDHGTDAAAWHAGFLAAGRRVFAPAMADPLIATFWWPRFEAVAEWLAGWEAARRGVISACLAEQSARLEFKLADGSDFRLRARLDRVDILPGTGFTIIDYKTGSVPANKTIERGFAPQLTLEAHMVAQGALNGVKPGTAAEALIYVKLSGGEPAGKETAAAEDSESAMALAGRDFETLTMKLNAFRDAQTGYISRLAPRHGQAGDYDHLARAGEWSGADDDEGGSE